jgi:hypothetical protein
MFGSARPAGAQADSMKMKAKKFQIRRFIGVLTLGLGELSAILDADYGVRVRFVCDYTV